MISAYPVQLASPKAVSDRRSAAGLPVELTITGSRALPPGVDLAAYRVVQEALSNVIKHANHARTVVRIEYRPRELLINVADDAPPADAGRFQPGAGRGLIGLRERIAIYGELDAGPRPGGGWRGHAQVPAGRRADGHPDARDGRARGDQAHLASRADVRIIILTTFDLDQ